jgi:hypothetical protein
MYVRSTLNGPVDGKLKQGTDVKVCGTASVADSVSEPDNEGGSVTVYSVADKTYLARMKDGKEMWRHRVRNRCLGVMYVLGEIILFASPTREKSLVAYRVADGEEVWSTVVGGTALNDARILDVLNGEVYVSSGSTVGRLDLADGRIRWADDALRDENVCQGAAAGKYLWVYGCLGSLQRVNRKSGERVGAVREVGSRPNALIAGPTGVFAIGTNPNSEDPDQNELVTAGFDVSGVALWSQLKLVGEYMTHAIGEGGTLFVSKSSGTPDAPPVVVVISRYTGKVMGAYGSFGGDPYYYLSLRSGGPRVSVIAGGQPTSDLVTWSACYLRSDKVAQDGQSAYDGPCVEDGTGTYHFFRDSRGWLVASDETGETYRL